MIMPNSPINSNGSSLKEACAARIEAMILAGELPAGEKLPPEREFAARLGVSRPVVHEALVELAMKGLVSISPRHGVTVCDFRSSGSLLLIDSLLAYEHQPGNTGLWQNLIDFRRLIEREAARLAALNRNSEQMRELDQLIAEEQKMDCGDTAKLTGLDFKFHIAVARISGNMVYPLLLNSFQAAYTSYTHSFFLRNLCSPVIRQVFSYHHDLVEAIRLQHPDRSADIMTAMLTHGEQFWKG
jgi:GntR family transcriptional regulator, transcriptional repressor for pyruvate dehydrogenase complex